MLHLCTSTRGLCRGLERVWEPLRGFSRYFSMLIARGSGIVWPKIVQHPLNRTEVDPRFRVLLAAGVFFAQDARPSQPGKRALNDPAARQDHKRVLIRLLADDLQGHAVGRGNRAAQPGIATIDPEFDDRGTPLHEQVQHIPGAIAIAEVGGMDDHREQITLGINRDVAFAPGHLFFPHQSRGRRPIRWFWWIGCRDSRPLARHPGRQRGEPAGAGHR
jgi:hypothetical protein